MWANPSWTNVPRHTTNLRSKNVHLIPVLNFARTTQNRLHHACVPTLNQRSKDTPQNLRPQDFHLTHPSFELCRNNPEQITPRMCANASWTNVPKTHHKTSDPKIFISHIPVLNFAGTTRKRLHHACVPTLNQRSKDTPQNLRPSDFHLTHLFWTLSKQLSMLHHTCEPTHPEPTSQDTLQTSDPIIFISHIPVLNFAGTTRNRLHHACVPTLNQRSKDTPQNLRPQNFHLTHPSFELCQSSSPYYTTHVCQPSWTNVPKIHHKSSDPKIFISHISVYLCWNNPEQITPRMCANPSWTNVPKTHHKTSDPKIFISHIPLLNFARAALHITPRMCANPSWTNVPRYTTNHYSNDSILQTHPHPTSQDTPLKISMFTVSVAKMSSLARRHGRIKTCVRHPGQKWFSVSFSGLNYLRPTYCKNALKRRSLG